MSPRETFRSRFGMLVTMVGVAVGLGNVWRFPYMVGKFGGASFVIVYLLAVVLLGIPVLMAEWALGRQTRRGTVGAFERAGLPFGRAVGWCFFLVVAAATAYYTNALGWVLYHAAAELASLLGAGRPDASAVLPPQSGFRAGSFLRQLVSSGLVILACAFVLRRGVRRGIERVSRWVMPLLLGIVVLLVVRALTVPGAAAGVRWYLLKFEPAQLDGTVVLAALGQAFFSLSLGGTFMVVYGSYLREGAPLAGDACWTGSGDLIAGLLAGLAIVPPLIALGLEPGSGPGLIFVTLPEVFATMPLGGMFGLLFFAGLFGAAYLSDIAAFEVLVAGITDNTSIGRRGAVWLVAGLVFTLALPSMVSMRVFVPWDLIFGSGMQTLGALLAVVTVCWVMARRDALRQLAGVESAPPSIRLLYYWLRYVVPAAILSIGIWWLLTDALDVVQGL